MSTFACDFYFFLKIIQSVNSSNSRSKDLTVSKAFATLFSKEDYNLHSQQCALVHRFNTNSPALIC